MEWYKQWSKQVLRIFGPELIRISINQNCTKCGFETLCRAGALFLRREPRNFENMTLVTRRKEHFGGFLAIFGLLNSQKRYFSTQEFTCSLSTVSSQRRVTRSNVSFKQSDLSVWSQLSLHPTHTYLWGRHFWIDCLLPTVTVTPSHSNYIHGSTSLKRFS